MADSRTQQAEVDAREKDKQLSEALTRMREYEAVGGLNQGHKGGWGDSHYMGFEDHIIAALFSSQPIFKKNVNCAQPKTHILCESWGTFIKIQLFLL